MFPGLFAKQPRQNQNCGEIQISQPDESGSRAAQLKKSGEHAVLCARVADEYKCKDVIVLDMSTITPLVDYFVIGTGIAPRQMRAVADEVDRVMEEHDSARIGMEGRNSTTWVLNDYGDIVLHLFSAEAREMYDLESLWADARLVDWKPDAS